MNRTHSILILAAVLLVSTACAFPLVVSNNENEVADAVAETVQAALAQTQAAATYTPLPTLTPYPTYTPVSQRPYYPQPTYAPSAELRSSQIHQRNHSRLHGYEPGRGNLQKVGALRM